MDLGFSDVAPEDKVDETPLDLTSTEQLVGLRLLLESALDYVKTSGPLRDVVGPVLLDGAVERAVFIAGNRTGDFTSDRDSMEKVFNALIGQRKESRPEQHIAPIRNLHKARNAAQHQGIRCNPLELQNWSISAQAMCDWLCAEFMGVNLANVTLAAAVEDGYFRRKLQEAEAALDAGEHQAAIKVAETVMREAYKAWEEQVLGRTSPPRGDTREQRRAAKEVESALRELHRGALVAALSTDTGESAWFVEKWTRFYNPSTDEVERYVRFVTRWVSAFEATPARSKLYRDAHLARERRVERTGAGPATVRDAVVKPRFLDQVTIEIQLEQVPQSGDFSIWAGGVRSHLGAVLGGQSTISNDGAIVLHVADDEDLTGINDAVVQALLMGESAIEEAHAQMAEKTEALEADRRAFEEDYRDVLEILPEGIHSVKYRERTGPASVLLDARTVWSDMVTPEVRRALTAAAPKAEVVPNGGGYSLRGEISPQELRDVLSILSANIVDRQRKADERRRRAEERHKAIQEKLKEEGFRVVERTHLEA